MLVICPLTDNSTIHIWRIFINHAKYMSLIVPKVKVNLSFAPRPKSFVLFYLKLIFTLDTFDTWTIKTRILQSWQFCKRGSSQRIAKKIQQATALSGGCRISQRRERQLQIGAPAYYLANFPRKLHENEEIFGRGWGEGPSLALPLRSSTGSN